MLSVSLQRKYNFNHPNTLLDDFQTNSRNIIGMNLSMVIPLLANQDLTPVPAQSRILISVSSTYRKMLLKRRSVMGSKSLKKLPSR